LRLEKCVNFDSDLIKFNVLQYSDDEGINKALICKRCADEVEAAFGFRHQILTSEKKYFRPIRKVAVKAYFRSESDEIPPVKEFEVCRVCLTSSKGVETKSIFKNRGYNGMEYVEMIFHLTELNVS
jgi:hypothetical protein